MQFQLMRTQIKLHFSIVLSRFIYKIKLGMSKIENILLCSPLVMVYVFKTTHLQQSSKPYIQNNIFDIIKNIQMLKKT